MTQEYLTIMIISVNKAYSKQFKYVIAYKL